MSICIEKTIHKTMDKYLVHDNGVVSFTNEINQVDEIVIPTGIMHQFVLKSGRLGKWKKAPKEDYIIEGNSITYVGNARFIKPIFILKDK